MGKAKTTKTSPPTTTSNNDLESWSWIPHMSDKAYILLTILAAIVTSYNTVYNQFVFDDERGIVKNPDLLPSTPLTDLLKHDFWGTPMENFNSHKSYRPVTVLSFRWNYAFSKLDPASYHLTNVFIHAFACALAFVTAKHLFLGNSRAAFVASLIFAVHSIHTEAIANIVGRAELLSAVFFLASILAYIRSVSTSPVSWSLKWYFVAILMGVLALLSKEQGVLCLVVCAAYDAIAVSHLNPIQALLGLFGKQPSHVQAAVMSAYRRRVWALALVSMALVFGRIKMNQGSTIPLNPNEHLVAFHPSYVTRFFSLSYYALVNVWLLLFPNHLCSDWSFGTIPLLESATDARILLVVVFLGALASLIAFIFWSPKEDRIPIKIGLVIALLTYLPSSGMFFSVGFVIAERILYLPSIGYCLVLVWTLGKSRKSLQILIVLVLIGFLSAKTIYRNSEWHSNFSIHEAGARTCSNNVKLLANYGLELHSKRDDKTLSEQERAQYLRRAETTYRQALAIDPYYVAACFNLGNLLQETNRLEEAAEVYERSLRRPDPSKATIGLLNNLASVLYYLKRYDDSEKTFLNLLQLDPNHYSAINGLASLYGALGKNDLAEKYFKELIGLQPDYAEARFNYGTLLVQMKRLDDAEKQLKEALRINPSHEKALNNLKYVEYERTRKA